MARAFRFENQEFWLATATRCWCWSKLRHDNFTTTAWFWSGCRCCTTTWLRSRSWCLATTCWLAAHACELSAKSLHDAFATWIDWSVYECKLLARNGFAFENELACWATALISRANSLHSANLSISIDELQSLASLDARSWSRCFTAWCWSWFAATILSERSGWNTHRCTNHGRENKLEH